VRTGRHPPQGDDAPAAPDGYSRLQIALHWSIAALVFFQLLYNEPMQRAFDDRIDDDGSASGVGALLHIIVGASVLVLAAVRVVVRLSRGAPPPHPGNPRVVTVAGNATHAALYFMIFAMPITGLLAWFAGSETSAEWHETGRLLLIALIGLHVIGALAEHFVFRRDSLLRMLRAG